MDTTKIRVILADDEAVARSGIRTLLAQAEDIEVVGEAQDGFEVQVLVESRQAHVLLLDLKMPGPFTNPVDLQRWLHEQYPDLAVLPLTGHGRDALLAQLKEAGVAGYLEKSIGADALAGSIRRAAAGMVQFDPEQERKAQQWQERVGRKRDELSRREWEVAVWLGRNATSRGIAGQLGISQRTVESHIASILNKLGMKKQEELMAWVLRHFPEEVGGNW